MTAEKPEASSTLLQRHKEESLSHDGRQVEGKQYLFLYNCIFVNVLYRDTSDTYS